MSSSFDKVKFIIDMKTFIEVDLQVGDGIYKTKATSQIGLLRVNEQVMRGRLIKDHHFWIISLWGAYACGPVYSSSNNSNGFSGALSKYSH